MSLITNIQCEIMTKLSEFYYYDIESITKLIRSKKAKNILLQVPEGLKALAYSLLDELKDRLKDVEIHMDLSPSYGSCLIDTDVTSSYELVINLGHEKYPYWKPPSNVYFIDLLYKESLSSEVVEDTLSKIAEFGKNVAIYSTAQHKHEVPRLAKILSSRGVNVINNLSSTVILGCWFSDLDNVLGNLDAVLIISGGYFHGIGVGLRIRNSKPVLKLDPYEQKVELINNKVYRFLKIRYSKIMEALDAKNWLLVAGTRGQYRPSIICKLEKLLKKNKANYYISRVAILSEHTLRNVDTEAIDAIIVTSCPRLPIEDLSKYHKPVLTPGEALMILSNRIHNYMFPW